MMWKKNGLSPGKTSLWKGTVMTEMFTQVSGIADRQFFPSWKVVFATLPVFFLRAWLVAPLKLCPGSPASQEFPEGGCWIIRIKRKALTGADWGSPGFSPPGASKKGQVSWGFSGGLRVYYPDLSRDHTPWGPWNPIKIAGLAELRESHVGEPSVGVHWRGERTGVYCRGYIMRIHDISGILGTVQLYRWGYKTNFKLDWLIHDTNHLCSNQKSIGEYSHFLWSNSAQVTETGVWIQNRIHN